MGEVVPAEAGGLDYRGDEDDPRTPTAAEDENDFSLVARTRRGHVLLKSVHKDQMELYMPRLPMFKVSVGEVGAKGLRRRGGSGRCADTFTLCMNGGVEAYLPSGFERFVSDDVGPSDAKGRAARRPAPPCKRGLLLSDPLRLLCHLPLSSPTQLAAAPQQPGPLLITYERAGAQPQRQPSQPQLPPHPPPATKRRSGGLAVRRRSSAPVSPKATPSPEPAPGPAAAFPVVVDRDALLRLYENGHSTPSERVGSFHSPQVGLLSPLRLYLLETAQRRQNPGASLGAAASAPHESVRLSTWGPVFEGPGGLYTSYVPVPAERRRLQQRGQQLQIAPPPYAASPSPAAGGDSSDPRVAKLTLYSRIEGALPLELFDDEESRVACDGFLVRYVESGGRREDVVWVACSVLRRDPATLFYVVCSGGEEKEVSRYVLRFHDESPQAFWERVARLKEARRAAERMVRTELVLTMMADDPERPMEEDLLNRVLQKTVRGLSKKWERRVGQYMRQVEHEHCYALRRACLQYYLLSPKFLKQVQPLDLETRIQYDYEEKPPPLPLDGGRHARFTTAKGFLSKCMQVTPPTNTALARICYAWTPYRHLRLLNTDLLKSGPGPRGGAAHLVSLPGSDPLSPEASGNGGGGEPEPLSHANRFSVFEEYCRGQESYAESVVRVHLLRWKADVEASLMSTLKRRFKYNYPTEASYRSSELARFLRVVKYMMAATLRTLVHDTLREFVQYLEAFVTSSADGPTPSEHWQNRFYKVVGDPPVIPTASSTLLVLRLRVYKEESRIDYEIPTHGVREKLRGLVRTVVTAASGVPSVDRTFLSSLGLPAEYIVPVRMEDEEVVSALRRIDAVFAALEPSLHEVARLYAAFEDALRGGDAVDPALFENLADISGVTGKVDELLSLRSAAQHLSPKWLFCKLFVVDCTPVKEHLVDRFTSLANLHLEEAARSILKLTLAASALYCRLWTEIQLRPSTPESFEAFRDSTSLMREELRRVEAEDFTRITLWKTGVADRFKRGLTDVEAGEIHTMQRWPMRITAALEQSDKLLVQEEVEFRDQVQRDRDQLADDLVTYQTMVDELALFNDYEQIETAAERSLKVQELLHAALRRSALCQRHEEIFSLPQEEWPVIDKLLRESYPFFMLWRTARVWVENQPRCYETPVEMMDAAKLIRDVSEWHRSARTATRALGGYPGPQKVASRLEGEIAAFHNHVPWIAQLRGSGIRARHWKQLLSHLACEPEGDLTVSVLLNSGVAQSREYVLQLANQAAHEGAVEGSIEKMKAEWKDVKIKITEWSGCRVAVTAYTQELLGIIDTHIVKTQNLRVDCLQAFENAARDWEGQLTQLQEVLTNLIALQETWMNLKPLFDNEDVCATLGNETRKFQRAHKEWCGLVREADCSTRLIALGESDDYLQRVLAVHQALAGVQHGLRSFLDVKRGSWGRLYYLTDDVILQMLASSASVSENLCKVFAGIHRLVRCDQTLRILAFESQAGERVSLLNPVDPTGQSLDQWLQDLESGMRDTLRVKALACRRSFERASLLEWMFEYPQQLVILTLRVCEHADILGLLELTPYQGLTALSTKYRNTVSDLSVFLDAEGPGIPANNRSFLEAVLLQSLTSRDRVEVLKAEGVTSPDDFAYSFLLKHVLSRDTVLVCAGYAALEYQYEYIDTPRVAVATPHTERAQRTMLLIVAGGRSAVLVNGPASSGKSHIVQDLAGQLGMMYVSQTCTATMSWPSLLRIVKGTVSAGAWGSLRCIEALPPALLAQLATVLANLYSPAVQKSGLVAPESWVQPTSGRIEVNRNFVVSATRCPGGAAGERLPEELRHLFRVAAWCTPDVEAVATHLLFLAGCYTQASRFGPMLAAVLLKTQGLLPLPPPVVMLRRTADAVASVAVGRTAYEEASSSAEGQEYRLLSAGFKLSTETLLASARDRAMLAKVFENMFIDHGEAMHPSRVRLPLEDDPVQTCAQGLPKELQVGAAEGRCLHYVVTPSMKAHLRSLHQQLTLNRGLVVCGQTGCGKTSLLNVLLNCHKRCAKTVPVRHTLVPASMSVSTMQGRSSDKDGKWCHGVLPKLLLRASREKSAWVVFDGGVGKVTEQLAPLLEDKPVYVCADGGRIAVPETLRLLFETESISDATPSFMTRVGLVAVQELSDWKAVFRASVMSLAPTARLHSLTDLFLPQITSLAEVLMPKVVAFSEAHVDAQHRVRVYPNIEATKVAQLYAAFVEHIQSYAEGNDAGRIFVDVPLVHAAVTVFVPYLDAAKKQRLAQEMPAWLAGWSPGLEEAMPEGTTPLDCFPIEGRWERYSDHPYIETSLASLSTKFAEPDFYCPSADSLRVAFHHDLLLTSGDAHCCLFGGPASGRTALARKLATRLPDRRTVFCTLSAGTTASGFRQHVEMNLNKRRHGVAGPALGKQCILVVDDLHLPCSDPSQPDAMPEAVVAFLKGCPWYDAACSRLELADVEMLCTWSVSAAPAPRLVSRLFPLYLNDAMSVGSMAHVAVSMLVGWRGPSFYDFAEKLVEVLAKTWMFLVRNFAEREDNLLLFSPGDVLAVVKAMVLNSTQSAGKMHQTLSLAVHEMCGRCCRFLNPRDVERLDNKLMDLITSMMFVQFADDASMPSMLRFTSVDSPESNFRTSTSITSDTLTVSVQKHSDSMHASQVTAVTKVGVDSNLQNVMYRAVREGPSTKLGRAMRLKEAGKRTLFKGVAYDHSTALVVSRIVKAIGSARGHCAVASDQGDSVFHAAQLACWITDTECVADSDDCQLPWEERVSNLFHKVFARSVGCRPVTWVLDEAFLTSQALSDLSVIVSSADFCGLLPPSLIKLVKRNVGGDDSEAARAMTDRFAANLRTVVVCSLRPSCRRAAQLPRRFPALVNHATFVVLKEHALSKASCMQYLTNACRGTAVHLPPEALSQAGDALYAVFVAYRDAAEQLAPYVTRLIITTFIKVAGLRRHGLREEAQEHTSAVRLLECLRAQGHEFQRVARGLTRVLDELARQKEGLEEEMGEWRAEQEEKQQSFRELEEGCLEKVQQHEQTKSECDEMLRIAVPAFDDARRHLKHLTEKQIAAVKCIAAPAPVVRLVMESVCCLLGEKFDKGSRTGASDAVWHSSQMVLDDPQFLKRLTTLNARKVGSRTHRLVRECTSNPMFKQEKARSTHLTVIEHLCCYMLRLEEYLHTMTIVTPKQNALEKETVSIKILVDALEAKRHDAVVARQRMEMVVVKVEQLKSRSVMVREQMLLCKTWHSNSVVILDTVSKLATVWKRKADALETAHRNLTGLCVAAACHVVLRPLYGDVGVSILHIVAEHLGLPTERTVHRRSTLHFVVYVDDGGATDDEDDIREEAEEEQEEVEEDEEEAEVDEVVATPGAPIARLDSDELFISQMEQQQQQRRRRSTRAQRARSAPAPLDLQHTVGLSEKIDLWAATGAMPDTQLHRESAAVAMACNTAAVFADPHGAAAALLQHAHPNLRMLRCGGERTMEALLTSARSGVPVALAVHGGNIPTEYLAVLRATQRGMGQHRSQFFKQGKGFVIYFLTGVGIDECRLWAAAQSELVREYLTVVDFALAEADVAQLVCRTVAKAVDPIAYEELLRLSAKVEGSCSLVEDGQATIISILAKHAKEEVMWTPDDESGTPLAIPSANIDDPMTTVDIVPTILKDAGLISRLTTEVRHLDSFLTRQRADQDHKDAVARTFREKYEPVVGVVMLVHATLKHVAAFNPLYTTSFSALMSIARKEVRAAAEQRGEQLLKAWDAEAASFSLDVLNLLYRITCAGMFHTHRLVYAFLLAVHVERQSNNVTEAEHALLLASEPLDASDSVVDSGRARHQRVAECLSKLLVCFQDLPYALAKRYSAWEPFLRGVGDIPSLWRGHLTPFQKLLLTKHLSPGLLPRVIAEFAAAVIPAVKQDCGVVAVFRDALFARGVKPTTPVFVLTSRAYPTSCKDDLECFASHVGGVTVTAVPHAEGAAHLAALEALVKRFELDDRTADVDAAYLLVQGFSSYAPEAAERVLNTVVESRTDSTEGRFRVFLEVDADHAPPHVCRMSAGVLKLASLPTPHGSLRATVVKHLEFGPLTRNTFALKEEDGREGYHQLLRVCSMMHAIMTYRQSLGVPYGWTAPCSWSEVDARHLFGHVELCFKTQGPQHLWETCARVMDELVYVPSRTTRPDEGRDTAVRSLLLALQDVCCSDPEGGGGDGTDGGAAHTWTAPTGDHTRHLHVSQKLSHFPPRGIYGVDPGVEAAFHRRAASELLEGILGVDDDGGDGGGGRGRGDTEDMESRSSVFDVASPFARGAAALDEAASDSNGDDDDDELNDATLLAKPVATKTSLVEQRLLALTHGAPAGPPQEPQQPRPRSGAVSRARAAEAVEALARWKEVEAHVLQVERLLEVLRSRARVGGDVLGRAAVPDDWLRFLPDHVAAAARGGMAVGSLLRVLEARWSYLRNWDDRSVWLAGVSYPSTVLAVFANASSNEPLVAALAAETEEDWGSRVFTLTGLTLHNGVLGADNALVPTSEAARQVTAQRLCLRLDANSADRAESGKYMTIPVLLAAAVSRQPALRRQLDVVQVCGAEVLRGAPCAEEESDGEGGPVPASPASQGSSSLARSSSWHSQRATAAEADPLTTHLPSLLCPAVTE